MNIQKSLYLLAKFYGSYSQAARKLGKDPRVLRRDRHANMSEPTRRLIRYASQALILRLVLKEIQAAGAVTPAEVRAALKKVNDTLCPDRKRMC